MKNVLQYLEESTNKNPNKMAIKEREKEVTYSTLLKKCKSVGSFLESYIVLKEPVGIFMEKGIDTMYAFFGTVYAGGFYVFLNPDLPIARIKKIIEIANIQTIITNELNYEKSKEIGENNRILKIEDIQDEVIDEEKLLEIRSKVLDVDPLYANFTSGSTGEPKGVVVSHKSVIDFIDVFVSKFEINENDIIANQAPFDFDVSVKDIYTSIKTSATLLIVPKELFSSPAKLLDYICENEVTVLIWAVSALCLITTFHGLDYKVPKTIRKIMFSGEVMPIKSLKQWIEHLPDAMYVNLYGPTEITCNCTYHIVDKQLMYDNQIPIGKAFDNEEVFLLDEKDCIINKEQVVGEICVRGTALSLGYYNNPIQTNKCFVQNPLNNSYIDMIYRTGDLGCFGKDNELYFSGRKDFQIKHMGHRIELEEIELEMSKIDGIERVCCIYDNEKSKLYSFYIGELEKKELHEKLIEKLPIFMIPNVFKQIENFPLSKNGKIDRKQLLLDLKNKKI